MPVWPPALMRYYTFTLPFINAGTRVCDIQTVAEPARIFFGGSEKIWTSPYFGECGNLRMVPDTNLCLRSLSFDIYLNGACARYVMVSKFQWKPFWLATQRDPQNDWTTTQNRVNYDVFAQAPLCKSVTNSGWALNLSRTQ